MRAFVTELRRRRVFRTAALYVLGAWLVMQAADVFFPGWGLPDETINVLLVAAILGFPLALVFGWFFDVTIHGIIRTPSADQDAGEAPAGLRRSDYAVLAALAVVAAVIVYDAATDIIEAPRMPGPGELSADGVSDAGIAGREKLPNGLAVLPFVNVSNDPDNESFCDGISEEILHRLSGYGELHVIGRTSSFVFKGSDYTIPRIAAILGVRYLLQGSVRREGDQVRILAQLVDDSGAQIWSSSYDRILESIFAIQDEISDEVASTVVPQITLKAAGGRKPDLLAYEYFLEGRESLHRREGDARELLARAVELDPQFAEAHAESAISWLVTVFGQWDVARAQRAIDTALELRPGLPRALAAQGLLLQQQAEPDWAGSEAILREVLEREPTMVDALNWLSGALSVQGMRNEAQEVMAEAYSIDPLHGAISSNMANLFAETGDRAQAEAALLRLTELPDPPFIAFLNLREFYKDWGRLVDMNRIVKRLALTRRDLPYFGLALNYSMLGDWESAAYWIDRNAQEFSDLVWTPLFPAWLLRWQGRYADALAVWNQAVIEEPELFMQGGPGRRRLGETQALASDYDGAVATLAPAVRRDAPSIGASDLDVWGHQHLAWAYIGLGAPEEARWMLDRIEEEFEDADSDGRLHGSESLYLFAQNALLLGDTELALDRLERAIEAGWRYYYVSHHDPRWQALADDPRFLSLMARAKADVDRQRAEVERIDAEEDFPAKLDRARASRP
jgi:TolB-like protein/tetratricopeptide (TPR) repeat protein